MSLKICVKSEARYEPLSSFLQERYNSVQNRQKQNRFDHLEILFKTNWQNLRKLFGAIFRKVEETRKNAHRLK